MDVSRTATGPTRVVHQIIEAVRVARKNSPPVGSFVPTPSLAPDCCAVESVGLAIIRVGMDTVPKAILRERTAKCQQENCMKTGSGPKGRAQEQFPQGQLLSTRECRSRRFDSTFISIYRQRVKQRKARSQDSHVTTKLQGGYPGNIKLSSQITRKYGFVHIIITSSGSCEVSPCLNPSG